MKNFQLSTLNFQLLTLLLAGVFALAGCNKEKEEDPFTGTDNYITAFVLQQGNTVFNATIANRAITITVPEGLLLTDAKATVTLSENAKIAPDPATITSWEVDQRFAVTAWNGARIEYEYALKRSPIAHEGTVVLLTQAEVDAFGAQGITFIDGNLTIGRTAGTDSIFSLAPLASLKEVAYNLTLNPTCAITGLEGLENLERIGGALQLGTAPKSSTNPPNTLKHLETLRLPALETAGGIELISIVTTNVELPELTGVSQELFLDGPFAQMSLPNLQSAGSLTITAVALGNSPSVPAVLEDIDLLELTEVGYMDIARFQQLTRINLPKLKKAEMIHWGYSPKLATIYTPQLEEVDDRIIWANLLALREMVFPKLRKVSSLTAPWAVETMSFPSLTHADEISVGVIYCFTALQTAGSVTVSATSDIVIPASVERIDYLRVGISNSSTLTIDVRGKNIDMLFLSGYFSNATLLGDDVFHGTLKLETTDTPTAAIPTIQGFSEVDSLHINTGQVADVHISGFRKVNRGAMIWTSYQSTKTFSLSDLEEIGGNATFRFTSFSNSTTEAISVGSLKRVGGNLSAQFSYSLTLKTLSFPELETVGGNFDLHTGFYFDYTDWGMGLESVGLEELSFPKLATVGGKLSIFSESNLEYANSQLTNLDGFAKLAGVGSIQVTQQKALTDYTGLTELFKTLPKESWITPTNCGYMPTWQDLKDGKWTKE
jgi:hypothetical protein